MNPEKLQTGYSWTPENVKADFLFPLFDAIIAKIARIIILLHINF